MHADRMENKHTGTVTIRRLRMDASCSQEKSTETACTIMPFLGDSLVARYDPTLAAPAVPRVAQPSCTTPSSIQGNGK